MLFICETAVYLNSGRAIAFIELSGRLFFSLESFVLASRTHTRLPLWSMFFSLHGVIDRWRLFDREATKIYNHDFHTSFFPSFLIFF